MTPREVAEALGLTPETIYDHIKVGNLEAKRIGGRWFISEEVFLAWKRDRDLLLDLPEEPEHRS